MRKFTVAFISSVIFLSVLTGVSLAADVSIAVSNYPMNCKKQATVEWDIDLFNNGDQAEVADVWLDIEGGFPITVLVAEDVEIEAQGTRHIDVSLYVHPKAQNITYTVNNRVGKFDSEIYDSESFRCRVTRVLHGEPHGP